MIDLAALFQEASEELSGGSFPAFPVSRKVQPEQQDIVKKEISGISGISGAADRVTDLPVRKPVQAGASAGAGERARDVPANRPEMPETPEKHSPAVGWFPGSSLKKPEKERETGNSPSLPAVFPVGAPSFEERAAFLEYECGLSRVAAEAQAAAETGAAPSGALALWRFALSSMSPDRVPCPGYRGDEWARTLARALDFLDTFGSQAQALGWTAPRLFGVHPTAGIVRVDCCGGLVLPGAGAVRAITATEISFGHLTHREKPGQPQGVPWWEFGR